MFISLLLIAIGGYLVVDHIVGQSTLTQSQIDARRAEAVVEYAAEADARREENRACLKRYEDMVATGEIDTSKLCGPPTRQVETEQTTFQKILDAAKRLILGAPALIETKENPWTR